ncbi:uncharacterized protein BX663DRAFT_502235 [Cokeromyces recurvatus]|uniref:uncharacterized protein n=1 Tax=Cokeromyces recurvatus TaxID=90255 RepID=UPI00222123EF|nr:uncharacterized protein BX663DRAFT_502235 [Cokeromyces recurvatus]KAI7905248.1 hypothetical protein BX663DRAFT_502235 [Cokeromyces recurvatus]
MATRKPSIQPRPTKASLLRLQKQQKTEETSRNEEENRPSSRVQQSTRKNSVGPSEGVKAFMAQQRARMAKKVNLTPLTTKNDKSPSHIMTGAQCYSHQQEVDDKPTCPRKIQVLIKQAKSTGKLDISNRGLTKIPEEVLNMYHSEPISVIDFSSLGNAWYDEVDLIKLVASSNAIEEIDERLTNEFGALKRIDFSDNRLKCLPKSLSQLENLTSLWMPYNQFEEIPSVLYELKQLKELNLSHNQIKGEIVLDSKWEFVDLSFNEINQFVVNTQDNMQLVKLNISHNHLMTLTSFERWPKLQELQLNQNNLRMLFPDPERKVVLPQLVRLDVGSNLITALTKNYRMPKLIELSLSTNKLHDETELVEFLKGTPMLQTLDISSNEFENISGLGQMEYLQRLDVRGNQLHTLPYDLGQLEHLNVLLCDGNPMRTYISMSQTQLIDSLKNSYRQQQDTERERDEEGSGPSAILSQIRQDDDKMENEDSSSVIVELNHSLSQLVLNSKRKLNLSNKQLSELPTKILTSPSNNDIPGTILLDHNAFNVFPSSLNLISNFIVHIDLEYNRIMSFNFSIQGTTYPHLKTLNLANNRLKTIECSVESSFPKLEELILNHNLITALPEDLLSKALPSLKKLLMSSNRLSNITERCFKQGLEVLDLSNNDIGFLPPGLSQIESLQELVVFGNRFRVPRPDIVAQGTEAILEFLKRRYMAISQQQ